MSPKTRRIKGTKGTGYTPELKGHLARIQNTLGLISLREKSVTEALKAFDRAVNLDPVYDESRMNLAAVSLNFRNYRVAEENFRNVLGRQPENYEALIGLGVALRGARDIDGAEAKYMEAQKLDPARPDSYFNLGLLYQDYKSTEKPILEQAQSHYRSFLQRAKAPRYAMLAKEANQRIRDIDDIYKALEEAARLQAEAEALQREAEAEQKRMEAELKAQEQAKPEGKQPGKR